MDDQSKRKLVGRIRAESSCSKALDLACLMKTNSPEIPFSMGALWVIEKLIGINTFSELEAFRLEISEEMGGAVKRKGANKRKEHSGAASDPCVGPELNNLEPLMQVHAADHFSQVMELIKRATGPMGQIGLSIGCAWMDFTLGGKFSSIKEVEDRLSQIRVEVMNVSTMMEGGPNHGSN